MTLLTLQSAVLADQSMFRQIVVKWNRSRCGPGGRRMTLFALTVSKRRPMRRRVARLAIHKFLCLKIDSLTLLYRQSCMTLVADDRQMLADQGIACFGMIERRYDLPTFRAVA